MRQQVVGFCELYMLLMGSWSVMGGSTLVKARLSQLKKAKTPTMSSQKYILTYFSKKPF